jgi:3-hydroxybutyryl-CoA dehydrogenase
MKNIAVIGAGTMGNGIAHVFAQNGYKVNLIDISEESLDLGLNTIVRNLDRMITKEKINEVDKSNTLANIETFSDLSKGASNVDLVVEAATERLDLKLDIFKELDTLCAAYTVLATNTSSISITQIAAVTKRPEKVIGMHFMNETKKTTMELSKKLGKIPTEVKDYPGFVANRILMPMINEAIETLYNGVAGVEEIDTVMKLGMAHPMGPLQLADFIGLDVCLSILNVMYDGFKNPKYAPCPLLVNMVMAKKFGVKSGEGFYDYSESKKAEKVSLQFKKNKWL